MVTKAAESSLVTRCAVDLDLAVAWAVWGLPGGLR